MNEKQFGGYTEEQLEKIARRMGHNGPMHMFNEFLSASPGQAAKFSRITEEARRLIEGDSNMATGGLVKPKATDIILPTSNKKIDLATRDTEELITPVDNRFIFQSGSQFIPKGSGQTGPAHVANANTVQNAAQAQAAAQTPTATVTTDKVADKVEQAVEGLQGAKGTVSEQAKVTAAQAQPSANATVQGQLEKLMSQFDEGNTPAWAAGAKRMVDTVMAGRGMGSSTMAASASTQALMESALEIAVRDASTYSAFEMQNLNNRQQAALVNAQSFLQMDLANLDNEQQAIMFKSQARIQGLFSDQAAENASRQFNATSQNQADQFFAGLKTTVSQFNAAQKNAIRLANSEQRNAVSMFNAQVKNQRDQFNATNRLVVDQANAKWRQEIATINNANINEANRINAQLATGMTQAAYNNMMQMERDLMSYVFTSAENQEQRAHEIVLQKLSGKQSEKAADKQSRSALWEAAGNVVGKWLS